MKRSSFYAFLPLALIPSAAAGADNRPNILLCIADDASRLTLGAYGCAYSNTPATDRLAAEGLVFTNAFTQNPKSCPSRACLATGMYSWQLKEVTNHWAKFPTEFTYYSTIMMENGYHVGFTGKGWGPGIYETEYNPAGPEYNQILDKDVPASGISPIDYAANFRSFLDQNTDGKPFCFWLGTKEPHRPYELDSWKKTGKTLDKVNVQPFMPDNDIVRGDLLDYTLEVEWYDTQIGKAVSILEEKGLLDNTVIIVTSDHGMPFPHVKGHIYDEACHIPLIVYWKGRVLPGRTATDYVGMHDIAPTILDIAGVAKHPQMSGSSFRDVLESPLSGRIDKSRDHMILCRERHDVGRANEDGVNLGYPVRAIRNDKYLYIKNYEPLRWPCGNPEYGYRDTDSSPTKTYMLSLTPEDPDYWMFELCFGMRGEQELYRVDKDPHCIHNLAGDKKYNKVMADLRVRMEAELKANGDPRMYGKGYWFDNYPHRNVKGAVDYIYHKAYLNRNHQYDE